MASENESETYGQDWAKVCGLDLQLGREKIQQDHLASVLFHSPLNCRAGLTLTQ